MDKAELAEVLDKHRRWAMGDGGGESANLCAANLCCANLSAAYLYGADLSGANLSGAGVSKTCLDPDNTPNGKAAAFEGTENGRVIGYRTRQAGHIDKYRDGRYYSADVFSTADTECHPGLYLWPTLAAAEDWSPSQEIITVETEPGEIHKAGSKYRCRWFYVIGRV